jgi:hypothetical protein
MQREEKPKVSFADKLNNIKFEMRDHFSYASYRPISFTGVLVPATRALAPRQGWRSDQGRGYKLALSGHPQELLTAKEEEF